MADTCDVVVIGAGLAGLICARDLHRAGLDVLVLESSDAVGGRIRTDRVDGMLLDRGFQLLNPSYPRAANDLDLVGLDLRSFDAGVRVASRSGHRVLADPRRSPRDLISTVTVGYGTLAQRLRLAAWFAELGFAPARRIKTGPDSSFLAEARRRGVDGELVERVLRPFLSGTLADGDLETSARFVELIVRSFLRGTPAVPASGMQAIPQQVADTLPPATVRHGWTVEQVRAAGHRVTVTANEGTVTAGAVVVAAGPVPSARLLGRPAPRMRALTTLYHRAPRSPAARALLHIDADHSGPVVNTAVMTDAAPSYAPGQVLVASSLLGAHDSAATETRVRAHLAVVYGCDTTTWEHVRTYAIADALPAMPPGTPLRRPVRAAERVYTCGDQCDTASIQGALVSGHRAASAVTNDLGKAAPTTA